MVMIVSQNHVGTVFLNKSFWCSVIFGHSVLSVCNKSHRILPECKDICINLLNLNKTLSTFMLGRA